MSNDHAIHAAGAEAPFTLTLHRGEGMLLLGMDWKGGQPPNDFVGFAIEYREPGGSHYFAVKNRLAFRGLDGTFNPNTLSTRLSPIQKFRWVHFPRNSELDGLFRYRVTPVHMDEAGRLRYGEPQQADIPLKRETWPGELNVTYTRGFVSSQAFVDRYQRFGPISTLLPADVKTGLDFKPTHPKADEALAWMGFEARLAILDVLDKALADPGAKVKVVAYDLNLPEVVTRLEALGTRLEIIIDDSGDHGGPGTAETAAAARLAVSSGGRVTRQHVLGLQHNKFIAVDGPQTQLVVCGSTNFSWRGFYVQSNNAVVLHGSDAVAAFNRAFDQYHDHPASWFKASPSAAWKMLAYPDVRPELSFSPHGDANRRLDGIGADLEAGTQGSLLYSLAFLYQTTGPVRQAITTLTGRDAIFVYGISDRAVGGLDLQRPDGNVAPVHPAALTKDVPPPFSAEPTGGGGVRMHHKFLVIDFDKPTARVYTGSYNFSSPADTSNGENLLLIKDRRVAVAYMVEAIRLFDHYHFRVAQEEAKEAHRELTLKRPPKAPGETAWFAEYYQNPRKIRDRKLFA